MALIIPWFWTPWPRNCSRINFCCFKSLGLWKLLWQSKETNTLPLHGPSSQWAAPAVIPVSTQKPYLLTSCILLFFYLYRWQEYHIVGKVWVESPYSILVLLVSLYLVPDIKCLVMNYAVWLLFSSLDPYTHGNYSTKSGNFRRKYLSLGSTHVSFNFSVKHIL